MKAENYLNIVEKLNDELYEICIGSFGMGFQYISNNYVDIIEFMGIQVFYSENDFGIETEEQLEEFIRSQVLALTNDLCRWQKYNGLNNNFSKIKATGFEEDEILIIPTSLGTPVKVILESEISDNPTNEDLFDLINKVKPI